MRGIRRHTFVLGAFLLVGATCGCSGAARPLPVTVADVTPSVPATSSSAPTEATFTWPKVRVVKQWGGFDRPLYVTAPDDGSGRVFVIEKTGRVRVVKNGAALAHPFLDISAKVSGGSEQGLLSMAFAPGKGASADFYVDYTDVNGDTVVSGFRVMATDPDRADPASERVVLKVAQPYPNHNGGLVLFGPDGDLYVGLGDGGSAGDPNGNGQNLGTLLAKILRLDVRPTGGAAYAIPRDNPFVGRAGARGEIWAFGLRNPWRFSFDRATRELYIGDVGQDLWEEIDVAPAGLGGVDYGWNLYEGQHPYPPGSAAKPTRGLTMPVAEYPHPPGVSVTGGYVYRGRAFPELTGVYVFADYWTGTLLGMRRVGGRWQVHALAATGLRISSFGEDAAGEVYLTDLAGGGVYRIQR